MALISLIETQYVMWFNPIYERGSEPTSVMAGEEGYVASEKAAEKNQNCGVMAGVAE